MHRRGVQCFALLFAHQNHENYVWFCMFVTDYHASGPDSSALGILNVSNPTLMVPQVLDEIHMRHDEQHLSAQEIAGLVPSKWSVTVVFHSIQQ